MQCVFVQLRCTPGKTYAVADEIWDREIVSELYSTSGDWDLLAKIYIDDGEDIGHYLSERLLDIAHIQRSLTTLTFKAF
ncbi:MAG: Lrp/AsnC ligand binding domain-containing protein [Pseudomonadota bacterium]